MITALVGNEVCSVFHVSPLVLSSLEEQIQKPNVYFFAPHCLQG